MDAFRQVMDNAVNGSILMLFKEIYRFKKAKKCHINMSKISTIGTVMITVNKVSFEAIYFGAQRSRIFGRASLFLTQTNLM